MSKIFAAIIAALAVSVGLAADPAPTPAPPRTDNCKDCEKCATPTGVPVKTPQNLTAAQKKLPDKDNVSQYLQDISVTIRAGRAEGSGVITNINGTNYVLTCGHVVAHLRKTRTVIGNDGGPKVVVEFDDAEIVKELIEDGRTVGELRFAAEVLRYSDADHGEDLALLRVRKKNLTPHYVHFYLEKDKDGKPKIPAIGTDLYHVGSLLGQSGSNSMTTGIYSQVGRLYNGVVYDQTTCAAFPGSSGGGVYLKDGRYVGQIVRGAGETFNLIVPFRRLENWAKKVGVDFVLDPSIPVPDETTLKSVPIENAPKGGSVPNAARAEKQNLKFMIRVNEDSLLPKWFEK